MAEGRTSLAEGVRALLLVLGIALAGLVVLVVGQGSKQGDGPQGSTFATSDRGAKAAFLMLGRLGHAVERRSLPLGDLATSRLAFLLAPEGRIEAIDGTGLGKWLDQGGTVVYGVDPFDPQTTAITTTLDIPGIRVGPLAAVTATVPERFAPARTLSLHASVRLSYEDDESESKDEDEAAADPLEKAAPVEVAVLKDRPVALRFAHGTGFVYVIDARVFSNEGLKAADNAVLLAVIASQHAGGTAIVFDEFSHGFGDAPSILAVTAWPLKVAAGVAALALLAYALAIGRRLGPPSPEPQPPRRASIEQIESLAAYFAAGGDRQTALVALAAFAGKPVPLPPPRDDRALIRAAEALLGRGGPPAEARAPHKGNEWPSTESNTPPQK